MSLDSNSKRSFNSKNTGGDNYNNNSRKKKKKDGGDAGQKTLGMAWGSNSRSSFRSSPFNDFGSYMAVKNSKLHQQFDAEASSSSHGDFGSKKPVFDGVSIFVDGYTVPSSQELRGYMLKHGGRFENYLSRLRVTHIICSNPPNSKLKNLKVVKLTWVLDSVAANKLLNCVPYQLDHLASETTKKPKLSAFLDLRSNPISCEPADINMYEIRESAENVKLPNQESECLVRDSCSEAKVEEPTCSYNRGMEVAETNEVIAEMQSKCSPDEPSTSERTRCSEL